MLDFSASLASKGLPTTLNSAADLDLLMDAITRDVLPSLKLYEYYVIDVNSEVAAFSSTWSNAPSSSSSSPSEPLTALTSLAPKDLVHEFATRCLPKNWDLLGTRFHAKVDQPAAISFVASLTGKRPSASTADEAVQAFINVLNTVNLPRYEQYDGDLATIISNTKNRVRYTRLDADGPKMGPITAKSALSCLYLLRLTI